MPSNDDDFAIEAINKPPLSSDSTYSEPPLVAETAPTADTTTVKTTTTVETTTRVESPTAVALVPTILIPSDSPLHNMISTADNAPISTIESPSDDLGRQKRQR